MISRRARDRHLNGDPDAEESGQKTDGQKPAELIDPFDRNPKRSCREIVFKYHHGQLIRMGRRNRILFRVSVEGYNRCRGLSHQSKKVSFPQNYCQLIEHARR